MASTTSTLAPPRDSDETPSGVPSLFTEKEEGPEKRPDEDEASNDASEGDVSPEIDDSQYPTGVRLAAVVAALALSMFLVSLDMVRILQPPTWHH